MATCNRVPRRPTAMEAAAMTAGPVRNLTAMEKVAIEFPHAMILGCNAINRPVTKHKNTPQSIPPIHHQHPTHILSVLMFTFYDTPFHHHHHLPTSSFLLYLLTLYFCHVHYINIKHQSELVSLSMLKQPV